MLEKIVEETKELITKSLIKKELERLNIKKGDNIMVHSSLSKLGFVCGKERALVEALMEAIGEDGNIVMPAQSGDIIDPMFYTNPPIKESWFEEFRKEIIPFDKDKTPTVNMGRAVEYFRNLKDVYRSNHPTVSFVAWGKNKEEILENHSLEYSLGDESPLKKIYDMDFKIVLIGVDFDVATILHLAEYRAKNYEESISIIPIIENGEKVFKKVKDIEFRSDMFYFIGEVLEEKNKVTYGKIGNGDIKIFKAKDGVLEGIEFFKNMTSF